MWCVEYEVCHTWYLVLIVGLRCRGWGDVRDWLWYGVCLCASDRLVFALAIALSLPCLFSFSPAPIVMIAINTIIVSHAIIY